MNKIFIVRIVLLLITIGLIITVFVKAEHRTVMYVIGCFLLVMLGIQIFLLLQPDDSLILVDKEEATRYYIEWLEGKRKISIPNDFQEYFDDETGDWYRMVFRWTDEIDRHFYYAPIEVYKYYVRNKDGELIIQLGHGRGKLTKNWDEVQAFILRDVRARENEHMVRIVNDALEDQLNQKLAQYGVNNKPNEGPQ